VESIMKILAFGLRVRQAALSIVIAIFDHHIFRTTSMINGMPLISSLFSEALPMCWSRNFECVSGVLSSIIRSIFSCS
jgi:hypothetical protein